MAFTPSAVALSYNGTVNHNTVLVCTFSSDHPSGASVKKGDKFVLKIDVTQTSQGGPYHAEIPFTAGDTTPVPINTLDTPPSGWSPDRHAWINGKFYPIWNDSGSSFVITLQGHICYGNDHQVLANAPMNIIVYTQIGY